MKAYKIKEGINSFLEKGRLFCCIDTHTILLATPTKPQVFYSGYVFRFFKEQNNLQEVELRDEKWVLPHLYKEIRKRLEKEDV